MNLRGICLERTKLQMTKYGFDFDPEIVAKDVIRLTNQLWKLIPMREKEEDWRKQLDTVIVEISGLKEIFLDNSLFLQVLSKLEGLKVVDITFEIYRKTVFEAINILQELKYEYS